MEKRYVDRERIVTVYLTTSSLVYRTKSSSKFSGDRHESVNLKTSLID